MTRTRTQKDNDKDTQEQGKGCHRHGTLEKLLMTRTRTHKDKDDMWIRTLEKVTDNFTQAALH